jgi:DNA-binding response OmpR family regulator
MKGGARSLMNSQGELVLVIDDDPAICNGMGDILEVHGYRVLRAYGPREALRILSYFTPDLLLVDVMMPDMDGLALLESLRAQNGTTHMLSIVVSAKVQERDRSAARTAGADSFLAKPFSANELLQVVGGTLRYARPREGTASSEAPAVALTLKAEIAS